MAQSPSFRLRDLAAVDVPAALELLDVEFPGHLLPPTTARARRAFLDRLHFPSRARHLALEVFARSFFAHPDDFSAGELVAMFHSYFLGSSEGLLFDVPRDDYDTASGPRCARYLDDLGVEVRTGEAVARIDASRRHAVRVGLGIRDRDQRLRLVLGDRSGDARVGWRSTWARADEQWRERVAAPAQCAAVRGVAAVAGPARGDAIGRRSSAPAASARWTTSRCWNASRTGARRWSDAARRLGGRAARVRARRRGWRSSRRQDQRLDAELHRIYPELDRRGVVAEEWLVTRRLPAGRHRSVGSSG